MNPSPVRVLSIPLPADVPTHVDHDRSGAQTVWVYFDGSSDAECRGLYDALCAAVDQIPGVWADHPATTGG